MNERNITEYADDTQFSYKGEKGRSETKSELGKNKTN